MEIVCSSAHRCERSLPIFEMMMMVMIYNMIYNDDDDNGGDIIKYDI